MKFHAPKGCASMEEQTLSRGVFIYTTTGGALLQPRKGRQAVCGTGHWQRDRADRTYPARPGQTRENLCQAVYDPRRTTSPSRRDFSKWNGKRKLYVSLRKRAVLYHSCPPADAAEAMDRFHGVYGVLLVYALGFSGTGCALSPPRIWTTPGPSSPASSYTLARLRPA